MPIDPLPETLLSESTLFLFGRKMDDIQLAPGRNDFYRIKDGKLSRLSPHHFTEQQLRERKGKDHKDPVIARIYAFSYQNQLIDLAKPALFVLPGEGLELRAPVEPRKPKAEAEPKGPTAETESAPPESLDKTPYETADREAVEAARQRLALMAGITGLGSMVSKFAVDMSVWAVDRDDYTVRLDVMTGPFDRILLQYEMGEDLFQGFAPRGGAELGRPSPIGGGGFRGGRGRGRRWRADDD